MADNKPKSPFKDPNTQAEIERRARERQQNIARQQADIFKRLREQDPAADESALQERAEIMAVTAEQRRRSREFFNVPEHFSEEQANILIDRGFNEIVNPRPPQDPGTVVQPPARPTFGGTSPETIGQPTLPTQGSPAGTPGIDFGDLGLSFPRSAQIGNVRGAGGPDANEGARGLGALPSIPGVNFGNLFESGGPTFDSQVQLEPESFQSILRGEQPLNPLDALNFITASIGGFESNITQFSQALDFFKDPNTGTFNAPVPSIDVGGQSIPVQALSIPRGTGITIIDQHGNEQQTFTGFEGVGAVIGISAEGQQQILVTPEVVRAYELGLNQEDLLNRLVTEVGDLSSADAGRRLQVALTLFGAEIDEFNTQRQLQSDIQARNLQRELAGFSAASDAALTGARITADIISRVMGIQADFGITELNNRVRLATAEADRQLQIATFEGENGIRFGDFAAAEAARERRQAIEQQQIQLQTLSTITAFLGVIGANPQLARTILGNPALGNLLGEFGIDATALFGNPEMAARGLPSIQAFSALTPAEQEALVNQLAAESGVTPENIRAEILQSGPVGTRRLQRGASS